MTDPLTDSLTGVKRRATSVAKNIRFGSQWLPLKAGEMPTTLIVKSEAKKSKDIPTCEKY